MPNDYSTSLSSFLPTTRQLEKRAERASVIEFLDALARTTTWIKFLYDLRPTDATSVLLAAAHSKIIELQILVPLGLIHSSYMALRTVVDICTSYTFYYSHPIEWRAICEGRSSWESRATIIEWHVRYTQTFRQVNSSFGLVELLRRDYQTLSSYVHGVPIGGLPNLTGIERISLADSDVNSFTAVAEMVDQNINMLLLSVFHSDVQSMSRKDLKTVTKGIELGRLAKTGIPLPRVKQSV